MTRVITKDQVCLCLPDVQLFFLVADGIMICLGNLFVKGPTAFTILEFGSLPSNPAFLERIHTWLHRRFLILAMSH